MATLLSEDVRLTMPPNPYWFTDREAIMAFVAVALDPASDQAAAITGSFLNVSSEPSRADGTALRELGRWYPPDRGS